MANYQQLKNALVDVIKQNGTNEITGEIMQTTLLSMINSLGANYQFAGILTPSTSFVPTDENIFYIGGAGSYSNFGASTINVPTGCIGIFQYNGSFTNTVINTSKEYVKENGTASFDASTLKSGTFGFVSSTVPTGLPNISYAAGAIIITLRQSDNNLSTFDTQFLITKDAIYCRMYNNGWLSWEGSNFSRLIDILSKKLEMEEYTESVSAGGAKWGFAIPLSRMEGTLLVDFDASETIEVGIYDETSANWLMVRQEWKGASYFTIPNGHLTKVFLLNRGDNATTITMKVVKESGLSLSLVNILKKFSPEILGEAIVNFSAPTNPTWVNGYLSNFGKGFINFESAGRIDIGVYDGTTSKWIIENKEWVGWEYIEIPNGHNIKIFSHSLESGAVDVTCFFATENVVSPTIGNILSELKKTRKTIYVGSDGDYQTLRSAIEFAYGRGNTTIVVREGVYDILQEFATEIASHTGTSPVGNMLGNGMELIFMSGSYVTCLYELSGDTTKDQWMNTYFNPFIAGNGDFTIENLNIKASNCRYCVHDELSGQNVRYIHKYINCRMQQQSDADGSPMIRCIGGGFGVHGQIVIDGGYYKSIPHEVMSEVPTISWHTNTNCDSRISIKDVYLADNGCFKFGDYGNSDYVSYVEVCGCSMGAEIITGPETGTGNPTAIFEVTEWNNIIRS